MAEKKILRLTCPMCETKLKVAETIDRFACLNCGTELKVITEEGLIRLEPLEAAEGGPTLSPEERELIEVNAEIRAKDDSYGVGCAISTMGIAAISCISILIASALQLPIMFGITLISALGLLVVVLLFFISSSTRETQPLLRRRDALQSQVEQVPPGSPETQA